MPDEKKKDDQKIDEQIDEGNAQDDLDHDEPPATEGDKEYADAWEELDAAEKDPSKDPDIDPEGKGLPEQKDKDEPAGKAPEHEGDDKGNADGKHEADESLAKALKDTKAWATGLAMDKAALEKEIKALKEGSGSAEKVAEAKAAVKIATEGFDDRVKKFYEDYPEAKEVLDPLIEITKNMATEFADIKKKDEAREQANRKAEDYKAALEVFTSEVKPKILEVHKDFDAVMKNNEYWQWASKQSPAMKFAAADSSDPNDIIMAVTAFKRYQASDETKALKEKQDKDRQNKLKNAAALRGGSIPMGHAASGSDPNNYEDGWESAGKELAKEGVR